ncbi:MAG: hypothetical protein CVU97_01570 [Firmicutes bacterium HGW-Firmicutes-21]|nr:MAG: hypothetical protein CVU97_01570 [Firmicutes bacterium HGW-Firmicutes-21]
MDGNMQQPNNFQYHPTANSGNGMAVAALVCGILGIIGSFIPFVNYFTLVLAILGIVFGAIGLKRAKFSGKGEGLATAGLVLGIVGTAFGAIGVICVLICTSTIASLA